MNARRRRSGGFTLIELMLVVTIIGVLANIALPAYQEYVIRSRMTEAFTLAEPAQKAVSDYYDRWGRLPADNASAGVHPPEAWRGRLVKSVRIVQGAVEVEISQSPAAPAPVYTVFLLPAINRANPTGPLAWACNSTKFSPGWEVRGAIRPAQIPPAKHLPAICR